MLFNQAKKLATQISQINNHIWLTRDVATCMYYTGIDPFTKKPVQVAKGLKDRKMQRALMQFFKPANYFEVREALLQAGRSDLIGAGCDALIPANPPKETLDAKRKRGVDGCGSLSHCGEPDEG
jgi:hypothetical protein